MKSCDNCLFYVDALPDIVICVGHKRVKEYSCIKENCKYWVENTPENATIELEKLEKQQSMNSEEMLDLLKMEYSKGRYDAITKAVEWLDEHLLDYWGQQNGDPSEFFIEFKKAMEQ